MKLREYFLCAKKTKITTLFNNLFSSVSVSAPRSGEYHDTCVWCCWRRSRCSDAVLSWVCVKVYYGREEIVEWSHWITWTILTMSLLPFCALNVVVPLLPMQGQKALGFHQKYLNLHPEDERTSYRGWVINDRSFIFGWTILLRIGTLMCYGFKWPAFYLSKWWVGATSYLHRANIDCLAIC